MRKLLLFISLLIYVAQTVVEAQSEPEQWFDFWIGKWQVSWEQADGKMGGGTNTIEKILDDKVIQEHFVATEGNMAGFKGTSISVYSARGGSWHQAWADNQGGYFDFIGEKDGARRIFKTKVRKVEDKEIVQRMVFYDIGPDRFTWDWELSEDGGASWKLSWRIFYQRMK